MYVVSRKELEAGSTSARVSGSVAHAGSKAGVLRIAPVLGPGPCERERVSRLRDTYSTTARSRRQFPADHLALPVFSLVLPMLTWKSLAIRQRRVRPWRVSVDDRAAVRAAGFVAIETDAPAVCSRGLYSTLRSVNCSRSSARSRRRSYPLASTGSPACSPPSASTCTPSTC